MDTSGTGVYIEEVQRLIRTHGWAVQWVEGDPKRGKEDPEGAPFAYTVGLTDLGHPEIVLSNVSPELGSQLLNHLGKLVRNGRFFLHGDRPEDAIQPPYLPVFLDASEQYLNIATFMYRPQYLRAIQMVLPDKDHRYPWNDGDESGQRPFHPHGWPF